MSAGGGGDGPRGPIDLNDLLRGSRYSLDIKAPETPEEQQSRLRREEDEAAHRRRSFWAVFAVVLLVGAATFLVILLNRPPDPEVQAWARTIFSAVVGGLVGYFTATRTAR